MGCGITMTHNREIQGTPDSNVGAPQRRHPSVVWFLCSVNPCCEQCHAIHSIRRKTSETLLHVEGPFGPPAGGKEEKTKVVGGFGEDTLEVYHNAAWIRGYSLSIKAGLFSLECQGFKGIKLRGNLRINSQIFPRVEMSKPIWHSFKVRGKV